MAISLKTSGEWVEATADATVTLVGTPAAGDRYFIWAGWKDYAITASMSGWTKLTEFADGTAGTGNGLGSMKVACWYRDWESGDTNPLLDFSSSPSISGHVCQLWQKGGTEDWHTIGFATAAWPQSSAQTINASSTLNIADSSVVMGALIIRDDGTFTRTTTSFTASPAVTWNGNYVESPATAFTTTTNDDMSADLGYRLVTTGNTGVTLSMEATLAASETGSALWVVQSVIADSGAVTVTPSGGSLTLTGSAPADHQLVTPGGVSAPLTGQTPSLGTGLYPLGRFPYSFAFELGGWTRLTLTGAAPTVTVAAASGVTVTPSAATLTLTGSAPPLDLGVGPAGGSLAATGSTPQLDTGLLPAAAAATLTGNPPVLDSGIYPANASVTLTGSAPTVIVDGPQLVTPVAAELTVTGSLPVIVLGGNQIATPAAASLTLTGSAPQLDSGIRPAAAAATVTGAVPSLDFGIRPEAGPLTLTGAIPTVTLSGHQTATPTASNLTLTGVAPTIAVSDHKTLIPAAASLTLTGRTPLVSAYIPRDDFTELAGVRNTVIGLTGIRVTVPNLAGIRDTQTVFAGVSNTGMALAGTKRTHTDL